jgi:TonB dependent receptor/Carboxypeptidase regulatory-like domain
MMRFLIAAVILSVAAASEAQQGTADLNGRVVDQQQGALPGVPIVVRHQDSGLFRETTSGPDGSFLLSAMTPGIYQIEASLTGFKKYQRRDVRLEVGRETSIEILLEVGSLQESVTVTAEAPMVDVSSKEIGGYVGVQELTDVPTFNRNFTGYLGLLPGIVAGVSTNSFGADSINANGQSVRNVNYTLDGSNNNDTFNAGNGGAQARIPVEAVQEFQLLTSQFDAEHGNTSGGIVNAVSRQGTNQFHGAVFGFFQDDRSAARDYFSRTQDLQKPETSQKQWGGRIGGPIIRDKAHFFFNLERIEFDQGIAVQIPARPDLTKSDVERVRVWNTLLRFDNQITTNHTWGLRWLRESSPQFNQYDDTNWGPGRQQQETDVDWTLVGTLSSVISSTKVNTLRLSGTSEDVFFGNPLCAQQGCDQGGLMPTLDYLSFETQQSARANRRYDVAAAMDDTFAWFVPGKGGDHDLKFGVSHIWASLRFQTATDQNGTFIFSHDLDFNRTDPRTYPERLRIRVPGVQDFYMKGHFIGLFAQDKWKMNNRLTLSLGLRYDLEILPTPTENPAFLSSDKYPIDTNNLAPRVGLSYTMDNDNRSVVRGGFGVFYQRTPYTFLTNYFSNGVFSDSFLVLFPTANVDPGPSRGQFPTDPMLVGGPTVNRALLNTLYPPGARQRNNGDVWFDNPDRHLAFSRQYSIGYQRQLARAMSVTLDYVRSEQRDQHMRRNLNPGRRTSTARTATVVRPDPAFVQNVWEVGNFGRIDYDALMVQLEKRMSRGFSARASYTHSRARGNVDTGNNEIIDTQVGDELNLDEMEGPTSIDRPHIFSVSGTWIVPRTKGLLLSGVVQARSGTTFTLTDSTFDRNQNGRFEDEYLPAGTYSGTGENAFTVEGKGGRRGARGPNYLIANLRSGYRIALGGQRTLDLFLDVFNITNRPNFQNPTGDRRLTNFLLLRAGRWCDADGAIQRALRVLSRGDGPAEAGHYVLKSPKTVRGSEHRTQNLEYPLPGYRLPATS